MGELLFFEGVPPIGCPCPDGSTHTHLHKGRINVDSLVLKLSHQIQFLKRHEIERALLCRGPEGQWGVDIIKIHCIYVGIFSRSELLKTF